jgi:flagellar biogenesis protein FliO
VSQHTAMPADTAVQLPNPLAQFFRAAFQRFSRPALWKRRRELHICETLSLGNRNFLAVVSYQDQRFLIAGTPSSISLLADVTRESLNEIARDEGDTQAA